MKNNTHPVQQVISGDDVRMALLTHAMQGIVVPRFTDFAARLAYLDSQVPRPLPPPTPLFSGITLRVFGPGERGSPAGGGFPHPEAPDRVHAVLATWQPGEDLDGVLRALHAALGELPLGMVAITPRAAALFPAPILYQFLLEHRARNATPFESGAARPPRPTSVVATTFQPKGDTPSTMGLVIMTLPDPRVTVMAEWMGGPVDPSNN